MASNPGFPTELALEFYRARLAAQNTPLFPRIAQLYDFTYAEWVAACAVAIKEGF